MMEKLVLTLITVAGALAFTIWGLTILFGVFRLSPLLGVLMLLIAVPCLIFFGITAYRQMVRTRHDPYRNIKY